MTRPVKNRPHEAENMKEAVMRIRLKDLGFMAWVIAGMLLCPSLSKAKSEYAPTRYGGSFGLGLELGDPGNWGIDGKLWIDRKNTFQGAVKLGWGGSALLQLDYLWHDF